jgi:hypothetical protein
VVTVTLSGGLYAVTAKTPVEVTTATCFLPVGTTIATFSSTGPNTYSGQHGLWHVSDCGFAYWDPMTLTLSSDGTTLTAVLAGGYGTVVFTKVAGSSVSNVVGNVINGKPGMSQTWALGSFDAQHTVTFSEPTSCFTGSGCPLDGWSASVNWGDSTAASTANVLCLVPPLPGPSPTPLPPVTVHCTVQGTHTYSARGAYAIKFTLNNAPSTINGEAEITAAPDQGAIKASVGEMVADDSTGKIFIPCTATTILSENQITVVSAAHCVGDLLNGGPVYPTLKFAPGHTGPTCADLEQCGTNPYGVFQATASDVTIAPNVGNQQRLDWAFIRFEPLAGKKLGQVVPGVAIGFNAPTSSTWTAIGYPHGKQIGPPSLGEYQLFYKTCSGSSSTYDGSPNPPGPPQLIIPSCADSGLTQGASGGPWLSPDGTVGVLNKAIGSAGLLGTYLGNEAQKAYLNVSSS